MWRKDGIVYHPDFSHEGTLACPKCHIITDKKVCTSCNEKTTREWVGYVYITNPKRSGIAKKLGIEMAGAYALKVR